MAHRFKGPQERHILFSKYNQVFFKRFQNFSAILDEIMRKILVIAVFHTMRIIIFS